MKNIAIITSGYFPIPPVKGGAIETLVNMLIEENELKKNTLFTVYSMYDSEAEKLSNNFKNTNMEYVCVPLIIKVLDRIIYFLFKNIIKKRKHMSYRYICQRLYFIKNVAKGLDKNNYDYVVFENHPTLLKSLKFKNNEKKYSGRYYYHAHNEITNTFNQDELLRNVKKFICVSTFIQNSISEKLCITNADQFYVLRNRVDEVKFHLADLQSKEEFMNKRGIPKGNILFTFTGRLNPEKGVKELLEAYRIAHPEGSKLIIAGSYYFGSGMKSEYEQELEMICEEIKEDIIFTGNIDYSEMPLLYAVSDVIVLPSIWNDPAPLTVIESITCGKPLITTNSGGIPEYVNDQDALIYSINDELVSNLARGIKELSENKGKRMSLSEAAKAESIKWTKSSYYLDFINTVY